jgi:hypothetical protein
MPRLAIDMGSRATIPVALNSSVPGSARIRRYDDNISLGD